MTSTPARFCWYELMTGDAQAAAAYYRNLFGWTTQDSGLNDRSYTIVSAGGVGVAGIMPFPPHLKGSGMPPNWMGYIAVDDVDAYAARVQGAGGSIHKAAEDIPGVGRFAVVADPYGAGFILFKPTSNESPPAVAPNTPGHVGWNELHAGDGPGAFAFYSSLFGWTKGEAMDMGPMGVYQLFKTGTADDVGGMMTKMPEMPVSAWQFYVNVDGIDAAVARATQGGGKLLMGPHEVPGGNWIANIADPQGAIFAMVSPKR